MKTLIPVLCILYFLNGCDNGSDGGSGGFINTVTGNTSEVLNVKIGAFPSDYWFRPDIAGDEDVVNSEFDAGTTGSFVPLVTVLPGVTGDYSIEFPDNPEDMGELIAWVDTDGEGDFDLGTESGYFPVKNIDGTERTILGFGYIAFGGDIYYLVSYQDDEGSQNDGFDIIGTTGYDFFID